MNTVLGIDDTTVNSIISEKSGHYRTESSAAGTADYIADKAYSHDNTPFLIYYFKSISHFEILTLNKKDLRADNRPKVLDFVLNDDTNVLNKYI